MVWFALGDRVAGTYLRRDVRGKITNVDFKRAPHVLTYTVKLDTPVKVTSDDSPLDFTRSSIVVNLDEEGQSVDMKNRPDRIARLAKE